MQFKDAHMGRLVKTLTHCVFSLLMKCVRSLLEPPSSADLQEIVTRRDGSVNHTDLTPCDQAAKIFST